MFTCLWYPLQIVLAYGVADAAGGLFHLATDRGHNFSRVVRHFLNHHERPWTMTFDLEPMIVGIPVALLGWWYDWTFLLYLGIFVALSQVPHYYTHHTPPAWIRPVIECLQKWHIFLPPEKHAAHHNGVYDKNFCVLAGWSDWWINWIAARLPAVPYLPVV